MAYLFVQSFVTAAAVVNIGRIEEREREIQINTKHILEILVSGRPQKTLQFLNNGSHIPHLTPTKKNIQNNNKHKHVMIAAVHSD